jgi:hypothetical protein
MTQLPFRVFRFARAIVTSFFLVAVHLKVVV